MNDHPLQPQSSSQPERIAFTGTSDLRLLASVDIFRRCGSCGMSTLALPIVSVCTSLAVAGGDRRDFYLCSRCTEDYEHN